MMSYISQIEEILVGEAISKGLVVGASCYWKEGDITHEDLQGEYQYDAEVNCLCIGSKAVYYAGVWAEALTGRPTVGKWYTCEEKSLFFITDISGGNVRAFGFDYKGDWAENSVFGKEIHFYKEVSLDVVKQALKEEALKRYQLNDFVDQTFAYEGKGTKKMLITGIEINFSGSLNLAIGGVGVFNTNNKGIWAPVVGKEEIDWKVPNLVEYNNSLLRGEKSYIVQTIGSHDEKAFSGVVISSEVEDVAVGKYSDTFDKNKFRIATKPVTLR